MKRMLAILLTLAMLLSLAACGGSTEEDPNAGKYIGVSAAVGGFAMPMSDVYPGETWIELKSGGKGTIMLDGDSFGMKWTLEGETFTLTLEGVDSIGTLSGGSIVIDLMDMGCTMTFRKEGAGSAEAEASAASYNDAGYYALLRIDSEDPDAVLTEEDLELVKDMGVAMYLELFPDGTGIMFMDEELPVTWQDGQITYVEDNLTVSYTLENGDLSLDMLDTVLVFRQTENRQTAEETEPEETEPAETVPMVSEMEQAGFTEFMEVGVAIPYETGLKYNPDAVSVGDAVVTSYEIFEEAEGYPAREGYEWRVAELRARFYDAYAQYSVAVLNTRMEDYYNTRLLDETAVWTDNTMEYTLIHQGKECQGYLVYDNQGFGPWEYVNGVRECWWTGVWAYCVPKGYDGAVAGFYNTKLEMEEGKSVIDYDPSYFHLFRLN